MEQAEVNKRIRAAVILNEELDIEAAVVMLTLRILDRVDYTYYNHPNEVTTQNPFRFIVVATLHDLRALITRYTDHDHPLPLIIHLGDSQEIDSTDYITLFPEADIIPVKQANLNYDPSETLQYSLFQDVVKRLIGDEDFE